MPFLLEVAARLEQPASFTKADVLNRVTHVEAQLAEVRQLAALMGDGGSKVNQEALERSLKVLVSLLERVQIILSSGRNCRRFRARFRRCVSTDAGNMRPF